MSASVGRSTTMASAAGTSTTNPVTMSAPRCSVLTPRHIHIGAATIQNSAARTNTAVLSSSVKASAKTATIAAA